MVDNKVEFIVNIGGTAYKGVATLNAAMGKLNVTSTKTTSLFEKIGVATLRFNNILQFAQSTIGAVTSTFDGFAQANQMQVEAETKLERVMRNTMGAAAEEIQSIKDLAAVQQRLGVIGEEVQLAGAQELGTYLTKADTLRQLIPVMNDMVAQQYGMNASQESAVNIASMMGKVLDGQVGALSRYGYKFDEAQEKILKYGTEEQRAATLAEVVSKSVGGMNKALAQTPEGQLKQVSNRIGDIHECIGKLYTHIKSAFAPVANYVLGVVDRIVSYIESKREQIQGVIDKINGAFQDMRDFISERMEDIRSIIDNVVIPVVTAAFSVLNIGWKILKSTVKTTIDLILAAYRFVSDWWPLLMGIATAIGIVTVAMKWQDIYISVLIAKEKLAAIATNIWAGAQAVLNTIMAANPIVLIVAIIMVLIGAIVAVCRRITGWGSLWEGVCGFMKYSFFAFVDAIKLYFTTYINGFMMALDKIKLGWYKFKESVGIGKSEENQAAIAEINADIEKRQQAIIDAAEKVKENAAKAKESLRGIEMGWKGKEETEEKRQKTGAFDGLVQTVNGNSNIKPVNAGTEAGYSANAVATGGTRNTQITINLGKMADINFNGNVSENTDSIKSQLEEVLLRVLYSAQLAG